MANGEIGIYGALRAKTCEGKVAFASQIYDEGQGKFQSEINQEGEDAVLYTPQTLTDEQKGQARSNIGAGDEVQSNKVTSWQSTPDDTHYPSEKLVKESIDDADKLVEVEYGVATFAQVKALVDAGKIPYITHTISTERVKPLLLIFSGYTYYGDSHSYTKFYFSSFIDTGGNNKKVFSAALGVNDNWSISDLVPEETTNKVTTIGSSSTDTTYPSAKAVYTAISNNSGAFDVSEANNGTLYASLSAALSAIPDNKRKGGMSIKFIQSSDNKYVQYRYMGTATTGNPNPFLDTANWQGLDDEPTADSENLVKSGGVKNALDSITEDTDIPFIDDKYIDADGNEVSWYDGACSDFVDVVTGDVFHYKIKPTPVTTRIVLYDSEKEKVREINYAYQSSTYVVSTLEITDANVKYIRCSSRKSDTEKYLKKINIKSPAHLDERLSNIATRVTNIEENIIRTIDDDLTNGGESGFININGSATKPYNGYKIKEFQCKKGEYIKLTCYIIENMSPLSKKVGNIYQNLIPSPSSFKVKTYEYTCTEDCVLVATYSTNDTHEWHSELVLPAYLLEEVESIKNVTDNIVETVEDINTKTEGLSQTTADDLTTGFVSGHFINRDGNIAENNLFGYKEFNVKNGSKITFECFTHPDVAPIAKKINDSKFQVLVAPPSPGFTTETFEYIMQEGCVIALSFNESNSRNVVIKTNYVDSNTRNVEELLDNYKNLIDSIAIQEIELGFMFNKIAVIGDSMSVATMDEYAPPITASWLSWLGKRWNCQSIKHYARGGASAYTWLNNTGYGLGVLLNDTTIYNAYFIAYGHNDNQSIGEATDKAAPVTIGEGNVPSCPSGYTFCAYYKAIINQIRTKAPHAMIFCLPRYDYLVAKGGAHGAYGDAVIDIADLYYNNGDKLVHYLDTGGVPLSDMQIGTHYSTIGYAYIASKVNEEANKVIYQYRADEEIKSFGVYNL